MFLVKREESRNFDMFFGGVLCVFWCLEERKKRVEKLGSKQISEKCGLPLSKGCLGQFIALACFSRRQPLEGRQPQKYSNRVDLDTFGKILIFQFLKRYGT